MGELFRYDKAYLFADFTDTEKPLAYCIKCGKCGAHFLVIHDIDICPICGEKIRWRRDENGG